MQINRLPLNVAATSVYRQNANSGNNSKLSGSSNNFSNDVRKNALKSNHVSNYASNDVPAFVNNTPKNSTNIIDQAKSDAERVLSTALVNYSNALPVESASPQYSSKSLTRLTLLVDSLPATAQNAVNAYVETGRLDGSVQLTGLAGFDAYA